MPNAPFEPPDRTITAIIAEGHRIWEDARYCYAGHSEDARSWDSLTYWLGVPATVIAAVTGVTSLAGQNTAPLMAGLSTNVLIAVLAFSVAALSGLSTLLDPKGQAARHYHAASGYLGLLNEARIFYQIECLRQQNVQELKQRVKKLSEKLDALNREPLIISRRAQRAGEKNIRLGKYDYEADQTKA
jgi:hypothetical protein